MVAIIFCGIRNILFYGAPPPSLGFDPHVIPSGSNPGRGWRCTKARTTACEGGAAAGSVGDVDNREIGLLCLFLASAACSTS